MCGSMIRIGQYNNNKRALFDKDVKRGDIFQENYFAHIEFYLTM